MAMPRMSMRQSLIFRLLTVLVIGCVVLHNRNIMKLSLHRPEISSGIQHPTRPSDRELSTTHQTKIPYLEPSRRNFIAVSTSGNMTSRIQQFNEFLAKYRSHLVNSNTTKTKTRLNNADEKTWIIINGDGYLSRLDAFRNLVTVMLPWQRTPDSDTNTNLLIQRYFPWSANEQLCKLIEHKSIFPKNYVKVFRKMTCNRDFENAMVHTSLDYAHLKANKLRTFSESFYRTPPENILHLHVLRSRSLVTDKGHVISDGIKLVADYCGRNTDTNDEVRPTQFDSLPIYDEVFTIKHPPGGAVYHGLVEELPRIAPFVEFLHKYQHIRIHATARSRLLQMLNILGFNKSRIISGPIMANILYVPRLAFCMLPRLTETQLLSNLYRRHIHSALAPEPRDRIVLILRSKSRRFENSNRVVAVVKKAAQEYRLRYSEFSDSPLPSINDTMITFQSAVMVVAAHGAGLSNILFSEPQTFVIEVVPYAKVTPLCYLHLIHGLGQHWHGLLSHKGRFKSVKVSENELDKVIRRYLTMNTYNDQIS